MNANPTPSWLDAIYYCRCRFYFKALAATKIDGFIGPRIRGALGRLLKRSKGCAVNDNSDCEQCPPGTRELCTYDRLCAHDSNHIRGMVLLTDPILDQKTTEFKTGDCLRFDLVMVGRDISAVDDILISLTASPLRIGHRGTDFSMVEYGHVDREGHFHPACGMTAGNAAMKEPMSIAFKAVEKRPRQIELVLRTPAEITLTHGKYLKNPKDFSFKVFVMRMVQRTGDVAFRLCGFEGGNGRIDQVKSDLIALSGRDVRIVDHRARWRRVSLPTHPSRTKGGMVGAFVYEGDLTAFLPFFDAATVLGIGKNTSHGFGQVSYRLIDLSAVAHDPQQHRHGFGQVSYRLIG